MTRRQLMEKRKKRKRQKLILRTLRIAGAAAAVIALICLITYVIVPHFRPEEEEVTEVEYVSGDTAIRQTISDSATGQDGWNVDDNGWWYKNPDDTQYVSGWKTIEGQRYYFMDDGYLATGWVNTGDNSDAFFDPSGILDPTAKQKLVALTYDDGPSQNTGRILDVLERYNAKATFFVVGIQADYYRDELKREYALGMEIGSHTFEHETLSLITADEIISTMSKNDKLLDNLIGFVPEIMRPTGGGVNDTVYEAVDKPMIQWDVDTLDWQTKDPQATLKASVEGVQDGSVILMHDLFEATADATELVVPALQEMGYKMVTISELAAQYGYTLEPHKEYYDFYPKNSPDERIRELYSED